MTFLIYCLPVCAVSSRTVESISPSPFPPAPHLNISWAVSDWPVQHTHWGREQNCIRLSDQIVRESKRGDVAAIVISFKSPCSAPTHTARNPLWETLQ